MEIMEILASYDLTRCAWSAAQLVDCDPKTVQRYVDLRDAGLDPFRRTRRGRLIDPHLEKVEELVERSKGKIRADVVHDRLRAMGFQGNERTTRRAVAEVKVVPGVRVRELFRRTCRLGIRVRLEGIEPPTSRSGAERSIR